MKCSAVMLLLAAMAGAPAASGPLASAIAAEDAVHLAGQRKIVCGDISTQAIAVASDSAPIAFAVGRPAPDETLIIRIPAASRKRFSPLVSKRLLGRQVCIDGTIAKMPGTPGHVAIDVNDVNQFKFIGAPPPLPEGFGEGAVTLGDDRVIQPVPIKIVNPTYAFAPDAERARVQGSVGIIGVVGVDGSLHSLEVVDSLDPLLGLDDAALKAASEWTFRAAIRGGQSTPFLTMLDMNFALPKSDRQSEYPIVQSAVRSESVAGGRSGSVGASFHTVPGMARITRAVTPRYPLDALRRVWEGDVVFTVGTAADGRQLSAKIDTVPSDAPAGVEAEAVKCVAEWRFAPGKINGAPVASSRQVVVHLGFRTH